MLVAVLGIALGAGHYWYWYSPRERAAEIDADSVVARLFESDLSYRFWMPYPHQNLATLSREVEQPDEWLAAAARLAGSRSWSVPRFGPFRFPPSRSLVVAADAASDRAVVAIQVYPAIAMVARLAGRVAGNAVLAGGAIGSNRDRLEVEWLGNTWLVSRGKLAALPNSISATSQPAALGWLAVGDEGGPLPPGRYRAARDSGSLVLSSFETPPPSATLSAAFFEALPAELIGELAFLGVADAAGSDTEVLLLARRQDDALRLPDAALLVLNEADRFSLPGESLARVLDIEVRHATVGRWKITALSDRGLRAAVGLGEALESSMPPELSDLLWVRPSRVRSLVEITRRVVETVPLVGRREERYWRDLAIVLEPLLKRDVVLLEVGRDGSATVRFDSSG